jgi:hypothetical protein
MHLTQDRDLIDTAYQDTFKKLFASFFDQYTQAGGSAEEESAAEQHFTNGVATAKRVYTRAIALLG